MLIEFRKHRYPSIFFNVLPSYIGQGSNKGSSETDDKSSCPSRFEIVTFSENIFDSNVACTYSTFSNAELTTIGRSSKLGLAIS